LDGERHERAEIRLDQGYGEAPGDYDSPEMRRRRPFCCLTTRSAHRGSAADGLSIRDVAEETGIPRSTVHRIKKLPSRMRRAMLVGGKQKADCVTATTDTAFGSRRPDGPHLRAVVALQIRLQMISRGSPSFDVQTVRYHLKRTFEKTDLHSQPR
jgi:hypothetical protein